MAIKQTIIVSRDAKPKKKYAPKEDFASRIGVVHAIIQLATLQRQDTKSQHRVKPGLTQLRLLARLTALALVFVG